jgi:ATP-dependent 26S proteasome regulatory subunit
MTNKKQQNQGKGENQTTLSAQTTLAEQSSTQGDTQTPSEQPSKEKKEEKPAKPVIDKAMQAKVNKHKAMFNNMLTHVKSKGAKCELITKVIEELTHPLQIVGTHKNGVKFIVSLSDEIREDNNQNQVLLLLNVEGEKFITLKPMNNSQLVMMMEQFTPGTVTIENEVEENK